MAAIAESACLRREKALVEREVKMAQQEQTYDRKLIESLQREMARQRQIMYDRQVSSSG
ncbi:hypothetical protein ACP4OV_024340 [Aristida adscensionis]